MCCPRSYAAQYIFYSNPAESYWHNYYHENSAPIRCKALFKLGVGFNDYDSKTANITTQTIQRLNRKYHFVIRSFKYIDPILGMNRTENLLRFTSAYHALKENKTEKFLAKVNQITHQRIRTHAKDLLKQDEKQRENNLLGTQYAMSEVERHLTQCQFRLYLHPDDICDEQYWDGKETNRDKQQYMRNLRGFCQELNQTLLDNKLTPSEPPPGDEPINPFVRLVPNAEKPDASGVRKMINFTERTDRQSIREHGFFKALTTDDVITSEAEGAPLLKGQKAAHTCVIL